MPVLTCISSSCARPQGIISNILEENVLQPLLVSTSAIELATETVCLLLRVDDFVSGTSFRLKPTFD